MNGTKPILLVEDDAVDIKTVQRAFNDLKIANRLIIATNGQEALDYLNNPKNEKPCVIISDINMPVMNGLEFLKEAKQDEKTKRIPVIILTTSREQRDKFNSFGLGVAGYIIKPIDYQEFLEAIKTIELYWTLSEFPM